MTDQVQTIPQSGGNAGMDALMKMLTQQNVTTSGGTGDTAALQQVLAAMMPGTNVAGMLPVIQAIFQQGFQQQMPAIYNASNQAGLRPGSTTQQALLVNDLNAKLSAEANKAMMTQQANAGQVAGAIAANTKTPTVQKQQTAVNTANITPMLLAAALAKGVSMLNAPKDSNSVATPNVAASAPILGQQQAGNSAADIIGAVTKQKGGGDAVTSMMDSLFGSSTIGTTVNTPVFNPNNLTATGSMSGNAGGATTGGDFNGGNFAIDTITNMFNGQKLGNSMASAGTQAAMSAIPVIGPYMAAAQMVGNALGVKEVGQAVNGVTNVVGDIGTGVADAATGLWNGITKAVGCFITTAICELEGKPDNCDELETLRKFRDDWLASRPLGTAMIQQYYDEAPKFLASIEHRSDRKALLSGMSVKYIKPAVAAVKAGNNEEAFSLYTGMLAEANKFVKSTQHVGA